MVVKVAFVQERFSVATTHQVCSLSMIEIKPERDYYNFTDPAQTSLVDRESELPKATSVSIVNQLPNLARMLPF
jgi:hypothetical protein